MDPDAFDADDATNDDCVLDHVVVATHVMTRENLDTSLQTMILDVEFIKS